MNPKIRSIDVMIAGAQKAGTSSLGDYLDQHHDITTHTQLEMAFFVRDKEYSQGYETVYPKYFPLDAQTKTLLAKSVGIMYFPWAMQRLYEHNPNCKIIAILREPVSRAYSAYWYMRREGDETAKSFAEAIALESERQQEDPMKWSPCLYRERGIYHRQIQNLYDCFGQDKVHVLLLDDLIAQPYPTMEKILEFMGIDVIQIDTTGKSNTAKLARSESLSRLLKSSKGVKELFKTVLPSEYLRSARSNLQKLNERSVDIPKIDPQSRRLLADFFEPHNQELSRLLQRPLANWKI